MVRRSTLAVSLVVVLVLLSGCSAVLDGGNGNGNGMDATGTDDPSTFDYADGYGPDGVTDGEAAVDSHRSALVDHGSYSGEYTYDIDDSQGTTTIDVTNRVEFEAERGLQRADVESPSATGVITIYRDSDTRYRRSEFNNQTSITTQNQTFEPENMTATEPIRPLLENVSQYDASMGTRDGDTVVVYRKSDAEGVDSFLDINESSTITSFNATFAVDADGVVRTATYEISYTTDDQERILAVDYSLSGYGETSVDRPAWVDEA